MPELEVASDVRLDCAEKCRMESRRKCVNGPGDLDARDAFDAEAQVPCAPIFRLRICVYWVSCRGRCLREGAGGLHVHPLELRAGTNDIRIDDSPSGQCPFAGCLD